MQPKQLLQGQIKGTQAYSRPVMLSIHPGFSRSTNLESKLIDFFAFLSFLANSQFWESSVRTIGNFPGFLSALASNNAFTIKLVKMWTSRTLVGTLAGSLPYVIQTLGPCLLICTGLKILSVRLVCFHPGEK